MARISISDNVLKHMRVLCTVKITLQAALDGTTLEDPLKRGVARLES